MKDKINKSFIVLCLVLLYLPLLFVILRIKVEDRYSNEKINGNFEKNFPLKDDYFSVFAYIKSTIFQTNPIPDKVLSLKDGWLFCGDSYSDNFSESKGFKIFTKNEIDTLQQHFDEKRQWLKENGIDYYLAIPPNKETVYGDLISVKKYNCLHTKREQLDSLTQKNGIKYIDLGALFPKNSKQKLFHQTDTHWNEYAAFYGYLSILKEINKSYKELNLNPISISDFDVINSTDYVGDLNEMLRKEKTEHLVSMQLKKGIKRKSWVIKNILPIPEDYPNNPLTYERRFASNQNKLKIMVINDSFGPYFIKFLTENFGETVFVWDTKFNKELIKKEKPDIIIQEIVERNVDFLLDKAY